MQQTRTEHQRTSEPGLELASCQRGASRVAGVLAIVVLTTFMGAFFLVSSVPLWSLN
jgi:hypothetical protein